ncbi:MAG: DNA-3-methyladenine glycosylase [Frankiaceae bacterium]|nr:DNA-3-methyladenine glycosylase [Frankiaceae bacterium]
MGDSRLTGADEVLPAAFYDRPVLDVAADLLGCIVETRVVETGVAETGVGEGRLGVRLTEVEAYAGPDDPGSHAFRGPTPRTEIMFGPPGHAYVYFSYGMHWCMNLVCGPPGTASAVLLRAGALVLPSEPGRAEAVEQLAADRRPGIRPVDRARGPARLTKLLGVDRRFNGADVTAAGGELRLRPAEPAAAAVVRTGPRVGLSAGADRPWRFWLEGEPTVSAYRAGKPPRARQLPERDHGSR